MGHQEKEWKAREERFMNSVNMVNEEKTKASFFLFSSMYEESAYHRRFESSIPALISSHKLIIQYLMITEAGII